MKIYVYSHLINGFYLQLRLFDKLVDIVIGKAGRDDPRAKRTGRGSAGPARPVRSLRFLMNMSLSL
jgi:hypothetical protein